MVVYKSRFLTNGEVWYDNEPDGTPVDWILYRQRSSPVHGARWKYFYSYIIDLLQSSDTIMARMNKDNAYKIRRARDRDKIACAALDPRDPANLDAFQAMYDEFADLKNRLPMDRRVLKAYAAAGVLDLSVAKDPQGRPLVYHANYRDRHRASNVYSASLFRAIADSSARNAVGRANRYLIWHNLLRYQAEGLKVFDFGGWYMGTGDEEALRINEFKRGFGGRIVREYKCEQILTLKGRVLLAIAACFNRAKKIRDRTAPAPENNVSEPPPTPTPAPASLPTEN